MRRKLLGLALFVAVLALGGYLLRHYVTVEAIAARETRLRAALDGRPLASFLLGLLAYTALSFLPLTAGKSLVFGWLFGLWRAVLMANLGLTVAAVAMFLLSRTALRGGLRSRFGAYMAGVDRAIGSDGAYWLFALRVMHAPYTLLNYTLGATSMRTRSFWWATQLGLLPGNFLFTYAGTQLPTLQEVADEGWTGIVSPQLIAAFVLIGLFPLAVRWIVRRFWPRAADRGADLGGR